LLSSRQLGECASRIGQAAESRDFATVAQELDTLRTEIQSLEGLTV
jgi:hypothetical protein